MPRLEMCRLEEGNGWQTINVRWCGSYQCVLVTNNAKVWEAEKMMIWYFVERKRRMWALPEVIKRVIGLMQQCEVKETVSNISELLEWKCVPFQVLYCCTISEGLTGQQCDTVSWWTDHVWDIGFAELMSEMVWWPVENDWDTRRWLREVFWKFRRAR